MNPNTDIDSVLISSNLGLYHCLEQFPYVEGLLNAPSFIAESCSLKTLGRCLSFDFRMEPNLSFSDFFTRYSEQIKKCVTEISSNFCPANQHIYLGGDHSITFVSLLVSTTFYERLGYIQFDSHGDMNLWHTSPSKNFHGMFLRPFLDPKFDVPLLESYITKKIDPSNVLFIGNLDLDPEEQEFFRGQEIKNIMKESYLSSPEKAVMFLQHYAKQFDHLHISFDIDVFNSRLVSSTSTIAQEGWEEEDVFRLLEVLLEHPHCSLDIVEFNPEYCRKQQDQSFRIVKRVIETFQLSRKQQVSNYASMVY